jgi:arylamine N-acetyltransferase
LESRLNKVTGMFISHFGIGLEDPGPGLLSAMVTEYSNIPYENLTKIIKKFSMQDFSDRRRMPEEVMEGYISSSTGGTCFSLTYCLGNILSGAGFKCYPVMADMKKPNIHCALIVCLDRKKYLVDPGYLLGGPVELSGRTAEVETPFGSVEIRPRGRTNYDLYTVTGSERKWRYRLKMTPIPKDLFMKYWERSFSLPMMNSVQLTRLSSRGHLYIRDHHLRFRTPGQKINENIRHNIEKKIESEFGIPGDITGQARRYIEQLKETWNRSGG